MEKFRAFIVQTQYLEETWKKFLAILFSKIPAKHENLGGQNVQRWMGEGIANQNAGNFFKKMSRELKMSTALCPASVVTQGICDSLIAVINTRTYKDGLVLLTANCACMKGVERALREGTVKNPIYKEWLECHLKETAPMVKWASAALNQIRGNDEMSEKHKELFRMALLWEGAFLDSAINPEKFQWPTEVLG